MTTWHDDPSHRAAVSAALAQGSCRELISESAACQLPELAVHSELRGFPPGVIVWKRGVESPFNDHAALVVRGRLRIETQNGMSVTYHRFATVGHLLGLSVVTSPMGGHSATVTSASPLSNDSLVLMIAGTFLRSRFEANVVWRCTLLGLMRELVGRLTDEVAILQCPKYDVRVLQLLMRMTPDGADDGRPMYFLTNDDIARLIGAHAEGPAGRVVRRLVREGCLRRPERGVLVLNRDAARAYVERELVARARL